MSDSVQPCGPWSARVLCPWDSLGKNTGMGCRALLPGIPDPGMEQGSLMSSSLACVFFPTTATWEAQLLTTETN